MYAGVHNLMYLENFLNNLVVYVDVSSIDVEITKIFYNFLEQCTEFRKGTDQVPLIGKTIPV